jgi:deoxyribodipyrimidine photo-lyase
LVVLIGSPDEVATKVASEAKAAIIVGDENPVRIGQIWRNAVAEALRVPFHLVDADVVVPASLFLREEFAARTIRPEMHRIWHEYLKPIGNQMARVGWKSAEEIPTGEPIDPDSLMDKLKVGGVGELAGYRGGTVEALSRLERFVKERLPVYAKERNEPVPYNTTELSAHLHFGQISPLTIALAVMDSGAPKESVDALVEELIVRRELSINFVSRNPDYDRLQGCPDWGLKTLAKHAGDPRPVLYSAERLEAARPATRSGTPGRRRWSSPAGCTIT